MSKSEYQKSYDEALKFWDNLNYTKVEPFHETNYCPMHPYHFFELSQVSHFNINNGKNYKEYISIWKSKNKNIINYNL